jgi:hypothetical protein
MTGGPHLPATASWRNCAGLQLGRTGPRKRYAGQSTGIQGAKPDFRWLVVGNVGWAENGGCVDLAAEGV